MGALLMVWVMTTHHSPQRIWDERVLFISENVSLRKFLSFRLRSYLSRLVRQVFDKTEGERNRSFAFFLLWQGVSFTIWCDRKETHCPPIEAHTLEAFSPVPVRHREIFGLCHFLMGERSTQFFIRESSCRDNVQSVCVCWFVCYVVLIYVVPLQTY